MSPREDPLVSASADEGTGRVLPVPLVGPVFVDLDVEGYGVAVVAVPQGAQQPLPVVVAGHGNYDRPEWQCEVWRTIVEDRAWILCPRGVRVPNSPEGRLQRYRNGSNWRLEDEIEAGLATLQASYPGYVSLDTALYIGFSEGASMGARIIQRNPELFARAILIEGSYRHWDDEEIEAYAEDGGQRVLFACGGERCCRRLERAARHLQEGGVESQVVCAPGEGHTYDRGVATAIKGSFEWIVEGW